MFRELFSSDLPYYILDEIKLTEEDFLSEIQHNVDLTQDFEGSVELSHNPRCMLQLKIQANNVTLAQLNLENRGEKTSCDITEDLNKIFFAGYDTRQSLTEEDFLDPESPEFANRALKSNVTTLLESGNLLDVK